MVFVVAGVILFIVGVAEQETFSLFFGLFLLGFTAYVAYYLYKMKLIGKKDRSEESKFLKFFDKNKKAIIITLVVVIFLVTMFCFGGFSSSKGSDNKKDEDLIKEYGYSVEDFYYQGSDGLWYPKN